LSKLIHDLREVMLPFTAPKLKERSSNTMKDYLQVAGPLGVTHFMIFSITDLGSYLKVTRVPQGPTLTFQIQQYSHSTDIHNLQHNPHSPGNEYNFPAVLIMSGFSEKSDIQHIDLMRLTFKDTFPAISVQDINLDHCRRAVLIHYDEASDTVEFRHYFISAQMIGINKSIKRVIQHKVSDLAEYNDISEYVLSGLGATESDNEAENSKITDNRKKETKEGRKPGTTKSIRLQELGPRMKLQLIKVEEELCTGSVHYHRHYVKTDTELKELRIKINARKQRQAHLKKKLEESSKREESQTEEKSQNGTTDNISEKSTTTPVPEDDYDDEDIEWYRSEVGEEPDEEVKESLKKKCSLRKRAPDSEKISETKEG